MVITLRPLRRGIKTSRRGRGSTFAASRRGFCLETYITGFYVGLIQLWPAVHMWLHGSTNNELLRNSKFKRIPIGLMFHSRSKFNMKYYITSSSGSREGLATLMTCCSNFIMWLSMTPGLSTPVNLYAAVV